MRRFLTGLIALATLVSAGTAFPEVVVRTETSAPSITVGSTFDVSINVSGITALYAYQFTLQFDPLVIAAQGISEGPFLSASGITFFSPGSIDNVAGIIEFTGNSLIGPEPGVSGSGTLAVAAFAAHSVGVSPVVLSDVLLLDSGLADIVFVTEPGSITVSAIPEPMSNFLMLASLGLVFYAARRQR